MEINNDKLELLRQEVEAVFGRKPLSPYDFDRLSVQIQARCVSTVGTSTLKRLWGYVRSEHVPTYTTLSVLCRYAGYRDWYSFCCKSGCGVAVDEESGFTVDCVIAVHDEAIGVTLRVEWSGDKFCMIRKIAHPGVFEVVDSGNIKLKPGDVVNIDVLALGRMFVATECRRGGMSLGTYHGAAKGGVVGICRVDSVGCNN